MVSPKNNTSNLSVSDSDSAAATGVIRPQRIVLFENDKIRDSSKKLPDSPIYKPENDVEFKDSFNNTIPFLPARGKKVPSSQLTTKPTRKRAAPGSPKHKADMAEETNTNITPIDSADQPKSPQEKHQGSPSSAEQPSQDNVSHAIPTQPRDAITIWKFVRGQTAAETRRLRRQQKERIDRMEAQRKAEQQATEKAKVQNEKMKFMVSSSDEAMTDSDSGEDTASEAYTRSTHEKVTAMANVGQSVERGGLIAYKDHNQLMKDAVAKDAPPHTSSRTSPCTSPSTSPRKQSPRAKAKNDAMDMNMGNEDDESPPHARKPQRSKGSSKMGIGIDEGAEDEKSPPHLRKPQGGRPNKKDKATPVIQLDEDDEEFPHKPTPACLNRPKARARAAVFASEDDQDEAEEPPLRNRRLSRGRQPKEVNGKARVAANADLDYVVHKSPAHTRAPRGPPFRAAKAKAGVIESEGEDEDMEDIAKSPPRTRGNHNRITTFKKAKTTIGDAPRFDPYDEAAFYTSFAGFDLNAPNKKLDKARMGRGMGPHKHK